MKKKKMQPIVRTAHSLERAGGGATTLLIEIHVISLLFPLTDKMNRNQPINIRPILNQTMSQ